MAFDWMAMDNSNRPHEDLGNLSIQNYASQAVLLTPPHSGIDISLHRTKLAKRSFYYLIFVHRLKRLIVSSSGNLAPPSRMDCKALAALK